MRRSRNSRVGGTLPPSKAHENLSLAQRLDVDDDFQDVRAFFDKAFLDMFADIVCVSDGHFGVDFNVEVDDESGAELASAQGVCGFDAVDLTGHLCELFDGALGAGVGEFGKSLEDDGGADDEEHACDDDGPDGVYEGQVWAEIGEGDGDECRDGGEGIASVVPCVCVECAGMDFSGVSFGPLIEEFF